ncbi:DUF2290 domain-containing protein [Chryseobacterium sp. ES2]|uniref:DUF2290 domain-containing protein n=1 Tax=Chryseobacterium metallicongregator TaxID=3073042 RepID=A0ABU1E829_9FLAO|nr:DUF2290 domain-containing protein [Chryseobacterium sp. ES2]MDR4953969.1 DUF2290 domain-containing protein [Chryseobacterium sp. ES2]
MKIDEILKLLDVIKDLHKDIIITNNFERISEDIISWKNYKSGIYKNLYSKEYENIIKNRQYSYLLKDNLGCIQFYYEFKDQEISKIKMAYYPYPIKLKETGDDIESYLDEVYDETLLDYYYDIWEIFNHEFELNINDTELRKIFEKSQSLGNNESIENLLLAKFDHKYEHTNTSHLRIDYDSKVDTHNKCEIQIGAINDIRIPIDKIISPIIFFDFIIKNILRKNNYYTEIKEKGSYKKLLEFHRTLKIDIKDFKEQNIHLI